MIGTRRAKGEARRFAFFQWNSRLASVMEKHSGNDRVVEPPTMSESGLAVLPSWLR